MALEAASDRSFAMPDYDQGSFDATRDALLTLSRGLSAFDHAFGRKDVVDPVRHLLATASGWGGLPDQEAVYLNVDLGLPVGEYKVTVSDVPVDGFWSISVYNAAGYFEPNDRNAYSVNNITATPDDDGAITVHPGGCADDRPNCLPITEGWNYAVRLYRPRREVLDGRWSFPAHPPSADAHPATQGRRRAHPSSNSRISTLSTTVSTADTTSEMRAAASPGHRARRRSQTGGVLSGVGDWAVPAQRKTHHHRVAAPTGIDSGPEVFVSRTFVG